MAVSDFGISSVRSQVGNFLVDHRIRLTVGTYLATIVLDLCLRKQWQSARDWHDVACRAGFALILCGLGLRSWAAGVLRKGRALTTTGPYRLCRHPLYLGTLSLLTGFALIVPDTVAGLVSVAVVAALSWATIGREERRIAEKYGSAWEEYAARTPRLLPLRLPVGLGGGWSAAQWLRSREYNAWAAALAALAALKLWRELLT